MIAALLAATRIASGSLQMSVGARAYPHVGPGGRDDKGFDTGDLFFVANLLSVSIEILEALSPPFAGDARFGVSNVAKSG